MHKSLSTTTYASFEVKGNTDAMIRQTGDGRGVESVLWSQFHASISGVELIRKTDAVGDFRTELEPTEIQIDTETYFDTEADRCGDNAYTFIE